MAEAVKLRETDTPYRSFNWSDPFDLQGQLTEEELLVQETAKRFADDRLAPIVRESFRNESVDEDLLKDMGELGLLGMTMPGAIWRIGSGICRIRACGTGNGAH